MLTDKEQVVSGCKRRDPHAMKQLYDELSPMMLGVCMRYTRSRDEAQDLLHDGFIKVYENINQLKNPLAVVTWVYQIMVNLSINYVTRNTELMYCDIEQMDEGEGNIHKVEWDDDVKGGEVEEIVRALQEIPNRYRLVFNMREVDEMGFDEIAEELKMPEATVRSYVARAKKLILEKIKK